VHQLPEFTPIVVRLIPEEETDAFFEAFYSAESGAEFERLAADLLAGRETARWRTLLAQCVNAYHRTDYLLVVPSLLAIFEGTLANVVDKPHARNPQRLASEELRQTETNLERAPWISIQSFTNTIFGSAHFADQRPLLLNRHWVLHGRDVPDWNRADCLRLFQAIHTLGAVKLRRRGDPFEAIRDPDLREALRARLGAPMAATRDEAT
jgi:hypothetical protein